MVYSSHRVLFMTVGSFGLWEEKYSMHQDAHNISLFSTHLFLEETLAGIDLEILSLSLINCS